MYRTRLLPLVAALALAGTANAAPVQLLTNGDFETGDFTGWTVTDLAGGSGSWLIDDANGLTPSSGNATVGPAGGAWYAVTDQGGPGTHSLSQSFLVPLGATSVIVSFAMFINDQSGAGPLDLGLDHTLVPNQHMRVDIMNVLAGAFSTSPIDIISNLVPPTIDAGPNPHGYTPYSFDITSLVSGGGTYTLRFGEVDNQFFFNSGVDDVGVHADVAQVPEPASLGLVGLGIAGLAAFRRVARQR